VVSSASADDTTVPEQTDLDDPGPGGVTAVGAATPAGVRALCWFTFRWSRFAQPPATCCEPFRFSSDAQAIRSISYERHDSAKTATP
jgi:hypothetical protein